MMKITFLHTALTSMAYVLHKKIQDKVHVLIWFNVVFFSVWFYFFGKLVSNLKSLFYSGFRNKCCGIWKGIGLKHKYASYKIYIHVYLDPNTALKKTILQAILVWQKLVNLNTLKHAS